MLIHFRGLFYNKPVRKRPNKSARYFLYFYVSSLLCVTHHQPDTLRFSAWSLQWGEQCHCSGLHWTVPADTVCPLSSCWPQTVALAGLQTLHSASCLPVNTINNTVKTTTAVRYLLLYARNSKPYLFDLFTHCHKKKKYNSYLNRGRATQKVKRRTVFARPLKLLSLTTSGLWANQKADEAGRRKDPGKSSCFIKNRRTTVLIVK